MSVIVFCNSSTLNASQSAGAGILIAPKSNSASTALAASRAHISKNLDKANIKPEAKNIHEFMQRDYKKLWPLTLAPYPKTEKIKPKAKPIEMPDGSSIECDAIQFPATAMWSKLTQNGIIRINAINDSLIESSILTYDENGNIIFTPISRASLDIPAVPLPPPFLGNRVCMLETMYGANFLYSMHFDAQSNSLSYKQLFVGDQVYTMGLSRDNTLCWWNLDRKGKANKENRTVLYKLQTETDGHMKPEAEPILDLPGKHTIVFSPNNRLILAYNQTNTHGYLQEHNALIQLNTTHSGSYQQSISFGSNSTIVQSGFTHSKPTQVYSLQYNLEQKTLSIIPLLVNPLLGRNAILSSDDKILWIETDEAIQLYSLEHPHDSHLAITPKLINEWVLKKSSGPQAHYIQDNKYVVIPFNKQTLVLDFNTGEPCARLAGLPQETSDRIIVTETENGHVNYDLHALQVLPKIQEAVFPTILPFPALKMLLESIAGPQPEYIQRLPMQEQTSKEEKDLQDTIAHYQTLANEERIHADKAALFATIAPEQINPDAIDRYVTYFTINATDEDFNTPLLKAIRCGSMPIIEKLLNWNTTIAVDRYCRNTVAVNLEQADQGQKAIELAIEQNKFTIACRITRNIKAATLLQMKDRILKLLEAKATLKSDAGYQDLKEKFEKIN